MSGNSFAPLLRCDTILGMIPEKAAVHMGELPEGLSVDGLSVGIGSDGEINRIAPGSCIYVCRDDNGRCALNRDVGMRRVGEPVNYVFCGKQTIIDFEINGRKEQRLLQCVLSPRIRG